MASGGRDGRALRAVLIALVLLVVLGALAPTLAAPFVARRLEAELEARTGGRARIGSLSLSWSGDARLADLAVEDDEGPILDVERAEAHVGLFGALRGELAGSARVEGLALVLRQRPDGTWSASEWLPPTDEEPEGDGGGRDEPLGPLPAFDLALTGRIELVGNAGTAAAEDLELTATTGDDRVRSHLTASLVDFEGRRGDVGATLELALDAGLPDRLQLDADLEAPFLRGTVRARATSLAELLDEVEGGAATVETLAADLVWRPDEVAVLLGPLLPVELSAREGRPEERLQAELSGTLAALDLEAALAGLTGTARSGLGELATRWLDAQGELALELGGEEATWRADLTANGGTVELGGALDPRAVLAAGTGEGAEGRATLRLRAEDVGLTSRLAPLLALVHPAFAAAETLQASRVDGVASAELDLVYAGPLRVEALSSETLATRLQGSGRLAMSGVRLAGAPALNEMLAVLGVDPTAEVSLRPLSFTITDGRLAYDDDWTWTIGGVETTFAGSVGLDRTLALAWNAPITAAAAERQEFLEPLVGRTLAIPITGTVSDPRIAWRPAVEELARTLARDELKDTVLEGLEDLGVDVGELEQVRDLLGEVGIGEGGEDEGEDPGALLEEADRLWKAGRREEAAVLYRRIREEHKLSLVYALNRDRIKERGR